MVSAPYQRKNEKTIKVADRAVKAHILKSILPTYGRFSRARSHIYFRVLAGMRTSNKIFTACVRNFRFSVISVTHTASYFIEFVPAREMLFPSVVLYKGD